MPTAIVWFRRDLRLTDNPALTAALASFERVIPLFVHNAETSAAWSPGAASRWWLHHSLAAFDQSLRRFGSRLLIRRGPVPEAVDAIHEQSRITAVYWNRGYEPGAVAEEARVKTALQERGITARSFNAGLLVEPWTIAKADGSPYRVFTAYWKACLKAGLSSTVQAAPHTLPPVAKKLFSEPLEALDLLPHIRWDQGLAECWTPGERCAQNRAARFIAGHLTDYPQQRDYPALDGVSGLSPYLHFGEIGPRQLVYLIENALTATAPAGRRAAAESFIRQLGWREFGHYLLFHFPHSTDRPLDRRFERFGWRRQYGRDLAAWQRGETGIPLVDAGMRELWQTGWMHNRVRMLVASLLTKNLLIPWQEGARWFWDTLVDADLANNTLGWQWTAGCGVDAAPYFRIFNPALQGERFDPQGDYVRRWVPELARLPNQYIHQPWRAPQAVLKQSGIQIGRDYPKPRVDLQQSRERALQRYAEIKKSAK